MQSLEMEEYGGYEVYLPPIDKVAHYVERMFLAFIMWGIPIIVAFPGTLIALDGVEGATALLYRFLDSGRRS